jgi:long-chain fatty acid transport protein
MRSFFVRCISTALFTAAAPLAFASGFQIQEQTASGLGIAYSGMATATQDAGTVFWNPAGMALQQRTQISASMAYISPGIHFTSAGPPGGSTYAALGNGGNAGVAALVPALYADMAVNPQVSVGLAVNAPFGLSTEWSTPWAGMFHAIRSHVDTLNINPGISFKVNGFLSIGAGVSYQRLRAVLTQAVTPQIPTAQGRLDGESWSWGWNIGALADVAPGTRIGLTYRSSIGYTIDSGKLGFNDPALNALASSARTSLKLPYTVSIGLAQELNPRLRLLADWTLTGWNSIQSLVVTATSGPLAGVPVVNDALDFRNSWRAGIGAEYGVGPAWLLRAGVAYDRTPVEDAYRTPRLPDSSRTWLALGARYQPDAHWSLDFGFAHLWVPDAASELAPVGAAPGALIGTYRSSINIAAIQGSYQL